VKKKEEELFLLILLKRVEEENNSCYLQNPISLLSFCRTMAQYPPALQPSPEDIKMMLACEVHRGSNNLDPNMERYIWQRRPDGRETFWFFWTLC